MEAGMLDDFIDRKHGRKKVEFPHPLLEPVLSPTYGTFVYQEQVMQAAQVMAKYSLGGADLLRRAMGKKKKEEMDKQKGSFISGCEQNGITSAKASEVFDTIEKFAGYGFNKSHSAAYALITYQTGYLKTFYPIEFMAALLTTEVSSTENVVKYIQEARTHGIEVLPPDINVSQKSFSVQYVSKDSVDDELRNRRKHRGTVYGRIRFGLSAVKGLGDTALEAILDARSRVGAVNASGLPGEQAKFTSLYHFLEECGGKVNSKILEVLIKSGALDGFGRARQQLFQTCDRALEVASNKRKDKESGQTSLFDLMAGPSCAAVSTESYAEVGEWGADERLKNEREAVGFYLSGHPLDRYVDDARKLGAMPTVDLVNQRHNGEAACVGIVASLKERKMKTGDGRWAVVTLEDTFGQAEVLCFSRVYEAAEPILKAGAPVLIKGRALIDDVDDDGKVLTPKMRAETVELLADAQIKRTRYLDVVLEVPRVAQAPATPARFDPRNDADHDRADDRIMPILESLAAICASHPGIVPTRLFLDMPGGYRVMLQSCDDKRVVPTDALIGSLERIRGVTAVTRT